MGDLRSREGKPRYSMKKDIFMGKRRGYFRGLSLVVALSAALAPWASEPARGVSNPKKGLVWAAFFSSQDCPMCRNVKHLLADLRKSYRFRFKQFDIDNPSDYKLFERLESIHSTGSFSVPLILIGNSVLMGERQIARKLEGTIRSLARSGGSPLPYLGAPSLRKSVDRQTDSSQRGHESDGRPPTIWEEWEKVQAFFEWLF